MNRVVTGNESLCVICQQIYIAKK